MGKKRGKGSTLTAVAPVHTRDLEQITDEHIAWVEAGSPGPMSLPAVYASVRLIASTINQLPVTIEDGAPAPSWLLYPRKYGTFDLNDLVQFTVTSMALQGAAYLLCTPTDLAREVWRIEPLRNGDVQAVVSPTGPISLTFRVGGDEVPHVPVSIVERVQGRPYLLHIPYLVTPEHPEGLSPIAAARQAISGYSSVERQAATLLGNGTYSGGRLETEQDITPATALRYQETWVANRKVGNLPVLGAGLRYVNDLIDPSDAQWLESRQYNNQQIAMMFGIPPDYLGMSMSGGSSSLSYANSQDNDRRFRRNCLAAFTQQMSDSFSMLLDISQRLIFDYTRWEGEGAEATSEPDVDNPNP